LEVSNLKAFEKITKATSVEDKIKDSMEPFSSDILTMKHLINILQDSNFQSQIDELRRSISDAKMRFSMPMPHSIEVQEEFLHESSKKSKAAPVSSKKPRELDLSPINNQRSQKEFQVTDDDLQTKLQNMFPDKSE
jgi:hypothetical protein